MHVDAKQNQRWLKALHPAIPISRTAEESWFAGITLRPGNHPISTLLLIYIYIYKHFFLLKKKQVSRTMCAIIQQINNLSYYVDDK